jgi:hypothetical protein
MKNPFMSMWLSAMNTAAGQMQGFWMAQWNRQQQAYMRDFYKMFDVTGLGSSGRKPPSRSRGGRKS